MSSTIAYLSNVSYTGNGTTSGPISGNVVIALGAIGQKFTVIVNTLDGTILNTIYTSTGSTNPSNVPFSGTSRGNPTQIQVQIFDYGTTFVEFDQTFSQAITGGTGGNNVGPLDILLQNGNRITGVILTSADYTSLQNNTAPFVVFYGGTTTAVTTIPYTTTAANYTYTQIASIIASGGSTGLTPPPTYTPSTSDVTLNVSSTGVINGMVSIVVGFHVNNTAANGRAAKMITQLNANSASGASLGLDTFNFTIGSTSGDTVQIANVAGGTQTIFYQIFLLDVLTNQPLATVASGTISPLSSPVPPNAVLNVQTSCGQYRWVTNNVSITSGLITLFGISNPTIGQSFSVQTSIFKAQSTISDWSNVPGTLNAIYQGQANDTDNTLSVASSIIACYPPPNNTPGASILSSSNVTDSGVSLSWTPTVNTTLYYVNMVNPQPEKTITTSTITSYNVTGLSPNTQYSFRIFSSGNGLFTSSNIINITTNSTTTYTPSTSDLTLSFDSIIAGSDNHVTGKINIVVNQSLANGQAANMFISDGHNIALNIPFTVSNQKLAFDFGILPIGNYNIDAAANPAGQPSLTISNVASGGFQLTPIGNQNPPTSHPPRNWLGIATTMFTGGLALSLLSNFSQKKSKRKHK